MFLQLEDVIPILSALFWSAFYKSEEFALSGYNLQHMKTKAGTVLDIYFKYTAYFRADPEEDCRLRFFGDVNERVPF